ncbi:LOW QUALITY PROTEIN: transcription factor bHLH162-like, partial [Cicer arietinum]|uniref:LOW QUALITY PROTEIN: transcription factor bHLH162-like n=1 Tax=Cicer arietinum TaxID=3827 RepID=A0A3Q7XEK7_CICAR
HTSSKIDRKFIERDRRNQMKPLYHKLNSLLPHQTFKDAISLPNQLEEATSYIKRLQIKLEKIRDKKNTLLEIQRTNMNMNKKMNLWLKSTKIEIQPIGLALEVVIIIGLDSQLLFNETIRVLREEGVDIVNTSYKVNEDVIFHSIHCQVGEFANEAARISDRFNKFMHNDY